MIVDILFLVVVDVTIACEKSNHNILSSDFFASALCSL